MIWCGICYMFCLWEKFPDKGDVKYSRYIVVDNKTSHSWVILGDNLMTHFQCEVYNLRNAQIWDPMSHILEDNIFLFAIKISILDSLWSWSPIGIQNNLITLKITHEVVDEVLGIVEALPDMGTFPLRYEIGMGVVCYTLIIYIWKVKYVGNLQWDSSKRFPTAWINIYEAG